MAPTEALRSGRKILDPILEPHGFEYSVTFVGKGQGVILPPMSIQVANGGLNCIFGIRSVLSDTTLGS